MRGRLGTSPGEVELIQGFFYMKRNFWGFTFAVCIVWCGPGVASATDVFSIGGVRNTTTGQWSGAASLDMVQVGNAGNTANTNGLGSVGYTYSIGEYDVTAAQYVTFLNAVASVSDPYGLYSVAMAPGTGASCGISQIFSAGHYIYTVDAQHENFPVDSVNWGDAARFCNWLNNGQPVGNEGAGTTESGSYTLNGALTNAALMAVTRNTGAQYVIPTASEWYKAAYYKGGGLQAGYWLYPAQSNTTPSNVLSASGTDNANYYVNGYTDPTHYLTPVGAFASSSGAYGTFDQGGDVFQWTEQNTNNVNRAEGGGNFQFQVNGSGAQWMSSLELTNTDADNEFPGTGFRVVEVPEPTSCGLIGLGFVAIGMRRRR
jgi:formylglycine-generating enzyme required for sulfatase activity